ncbi:ADX protein, partial [Polypterus senegalus]|nr:ADX protein [Polypterus senegalus]
MPFHASKTQSATLPRSPARQEEPTPNSVIALKMLIRNFGMLVERQPNFAGLECSFQVGEKVTIHFINQDGEKITTSASEGETLLDIVVNKNLDISGYGACEGTLACSTCHLIFDEDVFKKMGPVLDEEMDMLDLAYGLTDTSRLGCQICVQKWMDGIVVRVPQDMNDVRRKKESARK